MFKDIKFICKLSKEKKKDSYIIRLKVISVLYLSFVNMTF